MDSDFTFLLAYFLAVLLSFWSAFSLETHIYAEWVFVGVMTYPPITSCCQAIAPHWKKPDEINAGC